MNTRTRYFLFAALLTLPLAAQAADLTINVPVELTNVPAANTSVSVICRVGVGDGPTIWPEDSAIGWNYAIVPIPGSNPGAGAGPAGAAVAAGGVDKFPVNRNFRGTVKLEITALPGKSLSDATHYKCQLKTLIGQPALVGANVVSGAIPR